MVKKPAPGFHRFKVGEFEVTVVSDGPLTLGPPSADVFKGLTKEEMTQVLANSFLPTANVELEQNTLVVNTGKNLVLFDTGTGKTLKAFGPNAGRLLANLKAAGIDPKDIDAIAITHAHPDHCFGLMTESGKRNFPKAQIYITQADLEPSPQREGARRTPWLMLLAADGPRSISDGFGRSNPSSSARGAAIRRRRPGCDPTAWRGPDRRRPG
jgi:glyoxylase-like metal-dependent hydrolase (beta-lactamase superfamily II)